MTYTEAASGREPINWLKALNDENPDWLFLFLHSGKWTTCACGSQCSIIPRCENGVPIDVLLATYGAAFHEAIQNQNRSLALHYLEKIEIRSQYLIDELLKK